MIKTKTDPRKLILWHHFATSNAIYNLVENEQWFAEHPIPVFYAPKERLGLGEFILNDGHNRSVAAMQQGMKEVPIVILETTEDIAQVNRGPSVSFDTAYQRVLKILERRYEEDTSATMKTRLKEVRTRGYKGR